MLIGDGLGTTCTGTTGPSLYSKLSDYFDGDIWPTGVPCDSFFYDGGFYGAFARGWATDGSSCNTSEFTEARDCFDTAAAAGCDRLIIMGLLYNDLKRMWHDTEYPDEIFSAIGYIKDIVLYAQNLGMSVTYLSGYPVTITTPQENGGVDTGYTHTDCSAGTSSDDCQPYRNQNYHYAMTMLEAWFSANNVDFIDFHAYRVATDTPDDAFIAAYGTDGVHIESETGLTEWYDFIVERLNKKVTFVGVKAQGGVNTNGF